MTKHTTLSQDYTYNKKTYKAGSRVVIITNFGDHAEVEIFDSKGGSCRTILNTSYLAL